VIALSKGHIAPTQIVLITINNWPMEQLRCISFQSPDELQAYLFCKCCKEVNDIEYAEMWVYGDTVLAVQSPVAVILCQDFLASCCKQQLKLTNHRSVSLLMSSATRCRFPFFAYWNVICNWLTCLVHAESTGELISFGFSDCSVRSLVSANHWAISWDQTKNDFTFWLIFGLSPNLGLSDSLSKRLI